MSMWRTGRGSDRGQTEHRLEERSKRQRHESRSRSPKANLRECVSPPWRQPRASGIVRSSGRAQVERSRDQPFASRVASSARRTKHEAASNPETASSARWPRHDAPGAETAVDNAEQPMPAIPRGMVQWVMTGNGNERILVVRAAVHNVTHPSMDEALQEAKSAAMNLLGFSGKVPDILCDPDPDFKENCSDADLKAEFASGQAQCAKLRDGCCAGLVAVGMGSAKEKRERAAAFALLISAIVLQKGRQWTKQDLQWPAALPLFVDLAQKSYAETALESEAKEDNEENEQAHTQVVKEEDAAPSQDVNAKSEFDSLMAELLDCQRRLSIADDACTKAVIAEERAVSNEVFVLRCEERAVSSEEKMKTELVSEKRRLKEKIKAQAAEARRTVSALESREQELLHEAERKTTQAEFEAAQQHSHVVAEFEECLRRAARKAEEKSRKADAEAAELQRVKSLFSMNDKSYKKAVDGQERMLCIEKEEMEEKQKTAQGALVMAREERSIAQEAREIAHESRVLAHAEERIARDEQKMARDAEATKLVINKRAQKLHLQLATERTRNEELSSELRDMQRRSEQEMRAENDEERKDECGRLGRVDPISCTNIYLSFACIAAELS